MKKITSTILLLFVTFSFSQIKKAEEKSVLIGEAKNIGVKIASMYKVPGDPDYYFITYDNLKFTQITDVKSFGFKDIDNAFDYLYTSIVDGFKNKEKEIELELEDGLLTIEYAMGSIRFVFISNAGVSSFSGYITKKQFSTLFGKKYNKADFKK